MVAAKNFVAAVLLLAVLDLGSVAGSGSPRWEDWGEGQSKRREYAKLSGLFTDIDDRRMCDDKLDNIILFSENNCQGRITGSTIPTSGNCYRNMRWMQRRDNCWRTDEARSMFIRRDLPIGATVTLCDNAVNCYEDSYIAVEYKKRPITVMPKKVREVLFPDEDGMPQASMGYCVDSFEHSYEDLWVKVSYNQGVMGRGLDGAVTRIGACLPGANDKANPNSEENSMPYDDLRGD